MSDKLYRVVDNQGRPLRTGHPKTERTYNKKSTARSVASRANEVWGNLTLGYDPFIGWKVQETETAWSDVSE